MLAFFRGALEWIKSVLAAFNLFTKKAPVPDARIRARQSIHQDARGDGNVQAVVNNSGATPTFNLGPPPAAPKDPK